MVQFDYGILSHYPRKGLVVKRKIETAIEEIAKTIFAWEVVDSILVMENELDLYDPYFFISFDVYFDGMLPEGPDRQRQFSFTGAFETSGRRQKDRFIYQDIPFRIEYKSRERFSSLLGESGIPFLREPGTYALYRLKEGRILFQRSHWVDDMRSSLTAMDPLFWHSVRSMHQSRMEHCLNDMSAALLRDDALFFMISCAGFVSQLCSTLFAMNRRFEPSQRNLRKELFSLSILPDAFAGSLESLLRADGLSRQRQKEIAEYLAKRVIVL